MIGPLGLVTRGALRFPWVVVIGAVLLAVFALSLTARHMGLRTSRLDLLNPRSSYNKLWIDYINEFGDDDDAIVVVEGPSSYQVTATLDEIATRLSRQSHLFHAVLHEKDLSKVRAVSGCNLDALIGVRCDAPSAPLEVDIRFKGPTPC